MGLGHTDAAIYRALFPRSEARFWGSCSIIDPRITPMELARRTGLARSTVQARLKRWTQIGFFLGYEVWPNPRLFGAGVATVDIPAESPAEVDRLLDELSMVDGVLSARDLLDECGRTVRVHLVDDGAKVLARRVQLIRRIAAVSQDLTPQPYWIPDPAQPLSTLDWRIAACYRSFPDASLSAASSSLGITPRTLSTRRERLIESSALWWLLITRSARFPIAAFFVKTRDGSWRSRVKSRLAEELPGWIPCADDGFGRPPGEDLDMVAGLTLTETPASVDDWARRIASIAGVASVRWRLPRTFRSYREWLDRQLAAQIDDRTRRSVRSRAYAPPPVWTAPGPPIEPATISVTNPPASTLVTARFRP